MTLMCFQYINLNMFRQHMNLKILNEFTIPCLRTLLYILITWVKFFRTFCALIPLRNALLSKSESYLPILCPKLEFQSSKHSVYGFSSSALELYYTITFYQVWHIAL